MPPPYVVPEPCRLPNVSKLSNRVWRVMGLNPSPMTLGGTNCYILGTGQRRILLDAGEGQNGFKENLVEALKQIQLDGSYRDPIQITTVLLSHWHSDHGIPHGIVQVKELFPQCAVRKARSSVVPVPEYDNNNPIVHGEEIKVPCAENEQATGEGKGVTLSALHTPGHSDDHVVFCLSGDGNDGDKHESLSLFTGDCVLGYGSSVFACYPHFMRSLHCLLGVARAHKARTQQDVALFPAHGPAILTGGIEYMEQYIGHRTKREDQIWMAVRDLSVKQQQQQQQKQEEEEASEEKDKSDCAGVSLSTIVDAVYGTALDPKLRIGAANNAIHCLKKLRLDGKLKVDLPAGSDAGLLDVERDYLNDIHLAVQTRLVTHVHPTAAPSPSPSPAAAAPHAGCGSAACSPEAQNGVLKQVAEFKWTPILTQ